jgi:hypothetical protein
MDDPGLQHVVVDYMPAVPEFRVEIPSYGTAPSFPANGVLTKALGDGYYAPKDITDTRLTDLETNGGASLILTAPYTIPCASAGQGVYVKVAAPIANLVVGQAGTLFDPTPPADGEIVYIDPRPRLVILSPRLHLRTTNATNDVISAMLYINGVPASGGLLVSSSIVDTTYPVTLSVPFQAQPISAGDVMSIWVANLSSASDVELSAGSFLIASASLFYV